MGPTFPGVIAFAFMVAMILIGTVLRARIAVLQNALVPASLIGGVIGFALVSSGYAFGFASDDFSAFAFHFFTLSFMSLCLTGSDRPRRGTALIPGGMWLSLIWVMSLALQALVGLGVVLGWEVATGDGLSPFLGLMATHGFTQGPGQALAFGTIWEGLGVRHAVDFGLIYAAAGFLVAFLVGVPVARWAVRAGLNANRAARIDDEFLRGLLAPESDVPAGRQITHSANVDTLAFHLAILGVAYVVTDRYLGFMQPIADGWQLMGANLGPVFSHNLFFLHGLIVCVIIRALMDRLGFGRFIDNETQRRITGTSVDLMVVATIMSIQAALLAEFILPILLVCLAVSAVTAALCFGYGRRVASLGIERSLTAFGCCCGSTGTGILLLRILDPDLSTTVAKELAFFNIAILFLGFHVLTLMAPVLPEFGLGTIVTVYAATFVLFGAALWWLSGRLLPPDGEVRAASG